MTGSRRRWSQLSWVVSWRPRWRRSSILTSSLIWCPLALCSRIVWSLFLCWFWGTRRRVRQWSGPCWPRQKKKMRCHLSSVFSLRPNMRPKSHRHCHKRWLVWQVSWKSGKSWWLKIWQSCWIDSNLFRWVDLLYRHCSFKIKSMQVDSKLKILFFEFKIIFFKFENYILRIRITNLKII